MNFLKSLAYTGYHQLRNLQRLANGVPMAPTSLGSMTLDEDDVERADYWLQRREYWDDVAEIKQYETAFAKWNCSSFAYSFMGGRVALSAIIRALGLGPGDEVIIPGYTCVVVPNAFHYQGIETVYSDIELDTYGLDASLLETKISSKTKAILTHHLYGLVSRDYEEIISVARRHGLYVIEDCAHSTGATYKGTKVGNLGDAAFYSSEKSKVFNTIEGGIAVTNNAQIAAGIERFAENAKFPGEERIDRLLHSVALNYYRAKHPQRWWRGDLANLSLGHKELISTTIEEERGERPAHYGSKMPAPLAAIGFNQLKKLDKYNERRRQTARKWDAWCENNHYDRAHVVPQSEPVFLRYPVMMEPEKKRKRSWAVKELGVELGIWYRSNIHPAPWPVEGCPNADKAVEQCVNFPGLLD
jgi:perosamine synthetase